MMSYKETLFFIAKCLTISQEKKHLVEVIKELKFRTIDWKKVVHVSSNHYVLPTLYWKLKQHHLLTFIPSDLAEYMNTLSNLNRDRNQQIILQAEEINTLLLKNNITPIFLKGTAFILEDLYQDIAERMIGDIDFLVSKSDYQKTIFLLKKDGYHLLFPNKMSLDCSKHYPRLVKQGRLNAVEIHRELTLKKYKPFFQYNTVSRNTIISKNCRLLSFQDQLAHTIINNQINDKNYYYKNIPLRNAYDLFLLSHKTNTLKCLYNYPKLFKYLNSFLSTTSLVFNKPTSIVFIKNKQCSSYEAIVKKKLEHPAYCIIHSSCIDLFIYVKSNTLILIKALYQKRYFLFVIDKIVDPSWYKRRFKGIKKSLDKLFKLFKIQSTIIS